MDKGQPFHEYNAYGFSPRALPCPNLLSSRTREQLLRQITLMAHEAILLTDDSGCILLTNPCFEELFEYTESELRGQHISNLFPNFSIYSHTKKDSEIICKRKSGTKFIADVSSNRFLFQGLRVTALFIADVTKQAFLTMASHEFKTPLAGIHTSALLLEEYNGRGQGDKRLRHINTIKSLVKHLSILMENFLSLDKLDHGRTRIEFTELRLPAFIRRIIRDLSGIKKKGQVIRYIHNGGTHTVALDRNLLANILANLISNAIKYSPANTEILVCSQTEGDRIEISVKDEGMGIAPEDTPHVFRRFYRSEKASSVQGTGIGLHLVKSYTQAMGGRVFFQSEPGRGCEFFIHLPVHTPKGARSHECGD